MYRSARWATALFLATLLLAVAQAWAGVDEDYESALKSYQEGDVVGAMTALRKGADSGHARSQVLLAELLDRAEFDEEAVVYYRKAAELGDTDGMFGYGVMIAAGEGVKSRMPLEGRAWILKAAELGHKQAINVIGQAYLKGELGLSERDRMTVEALRWIQAAAENDYLPAVDALADAYRTGHGLAVNADAKLSEQFFAQANRLRGIDPAKKKRRGRKVAG